MSEDENVPLLPSLEEEFDEDSDVASSKVTSTRIEEGHTCRCTMKMVVFVVIGLALLVIFIGIVLGITLPLVEMASKTSKSSNTTFPTHTSSSSSSTSTLHSSQSLSVTGQPHRTISATSVINPTPSHVATSAYSASSLTSYHGSSLRLSSSGGTSLLPTSALPISSSKVLNIVSMSVHLQ